MIVRRQRDDDVQAVREVLAAAFATGGGEPAEVALVDELRRSDAWIPALSWVAEAAGSIIGYGVCTRGDVGDLACVGLAPLAVRSDVQRRGVGSALTHALIGAADALGEPLIALLGDVSYYARFGFVASTELGIEPPEPEWGEHFQVRPLSSWPGSVAGTFRYAEAFENLG